ncbi:MAG: hypothetical protein JWO89_462 [Verrucomicrobiaceae bacterium]|nr:hypothetical protein [Verrucomicrobiaceae bacterium]
MKLLIHDFIYRWRWVIFGYFCAVIFFTVLDRGLPLAVVAMLCFMADWQKGVVRVVRPLPVSIRHQALAWWFVCVGLLPLLGLVGIGIGLWLGGRVPFLPHEFAEGFVHWKDTRGPYSVPQLKTDPGFAVIIGWWVGLGASALLYLPQVVVPRANSSPLLRRIWQWVVAMTMGLAVPGMMMMMMFGPQRLEQMKPAYWVACATVPLWVVWSFVTAFRQPPPMLPSMQALAIGSEPAVATPIQRGLGGMPALLLMMHGRLLLMLALMVGMFHLMYLYVLKSKVGSSTELGSPIALQLIMMGSISCTMCGDIWSMRSLRTLPLSTARLALLLLGVPLVLGVAVGGYSPVGALSVYGSVTPVQAWTNGLLTAVLGSLCLTVGLYFTTGRRLLFCGIMFPLMACGSIFGMKWLMVNPSATGTIGALIIVVCYTLIFRGLHRSSEFYRVRQLPGAWGQVSMRG